MVFRISDKQKPTFIVVPYGFPNSLSDEGGQERRYYARPGEVGRSIAVIFARTLGKNFLSRQKVAKR